MKRFAEIGGDDVKTNKFINLKEKRITINNQVYKKRGRAELRGRHYNNIPDVFAEWIEYLGENGIKINCSRRQDHYTRKEAGR